MTLRMPIEIVMSVDMRVYLVGVFIYLPIFVPSRYTQDRVVLIIDFGWVVATLHKYVVVFISILDKHSLLLNTFFISNFGRNIFLCQVINNKYYFVNRAVLTVPSDFSTSPIQSFGQRRHTFTYYLSHMHRHCHYTGNTPRTPRPAPF